WRRAAESAGQRPKIAPRTTEPTTPPMTTRGSMLVGIGLTRSISAAAPAPRATPSAPPRSATITASQRNCIRIVPPRAPRARQHPEAVLRAAEGVALADRRAHPRAAGGGPDLEALAHRVLPLEGGVLEVGADHAGVGAELVIEIADEAPAPELPAAGLEEGL